MEQAFNQITNIIDRLLALKDRVIVAIDGPCASGKTTLAVKLRDHYRCTLLHMDDFFLRPEQRTPERFAQPGGNVDYERFAAEVLEPLTAGRSFFFCPFDCGTMTLSAPVSITPERLTVIEGSYSHHPHFGDYCDLRILLQVEPGLQTERILNRPAFLHQRFFREWIPMEQRYFEAFRIPEKADLILRSEHM